MPPSKTTTNCAASSPSATSKYPDKPAQPGRSQLRKEGDGYFQEQFDHFSGCLIICNSGSAFEPSSRRQGKDGLRETEKGSAPRCTTSSVSNALSSAKHSPLHQRLFGSLVSCGLFDKQTIPARIIESPVSCRLECYYTGVSAVPVLHRPHPAPAAKNRPTDREPPAPASLQAQ
eukprot:9476190-Pyramimonas_sp.AAC.1